MSELSKQVSAAECASEVSSVEQANDEQCERTSKRTSEWPSTAVWVLSYSGPQCAGCGTVFGDAMAMIQETDKSNYRRWRTPPDGWVKA